MISAIKRNIRNTQIQKRCTEFLYFTFFWCTLWLSATTMQDQFQDEEGQPVKLDEQLGTKRWG